MALPDYTSTTGFARPSARERHKARNILQRDRRQERRQDRRQGGKTTYPASTPTAQPTSYAQPQSGYNGVYTPPANSGSHPFFDPQASQANTGDQAGGSQWLQPGSQGYNLYGTLNPAAYYTNRLGHLGLGGLDARSQTAQGMYRDWAAGYEAAKFQNPELLFPDFMEMQNIPGLLDQMSEEQIGIDRGRYQDRSRWGFRGGI